MSEPYRALTIDADEFWNNEAVKFAVDKIPMLRCVVYPNRIYRDYFEKAKRDGISLREQCSHVGLPWQCRKIKAEAVCPELIWAANRMSGRRFLTEIALIEDVYSAKRLYGKVQKIFDLLGEWTPQADWMLDNYLHIFTVLEAPQIIAAYLREVDDFDTKQSVQTVLRKIMPVATVRNASEVSDEHVEIAAKLGHIASTVPPEMVKSVDHGDFKVTVLETFADCFEHGQRVKNCLRFFAHFSVYKSIGDPVCKVQVRKGDEMVDVATARFHLFEAWYLVEVKGIAGSAEVLLGALEALEEFRIINNALLYNDETRESLKKNLPDRAAALARRYHIGGLSSGAGGAGAMSQGEVLARGLVFAEREVQSGRVGGVTVGDDGSIRVDFRWGDDDDDDDDYLDERSLGALLAPRTTWRVWEPPTPQPPPDGAADENLFDRVMRTLTNALNRGRWG